MSINLNRLYTQATNETQASGLSWYSDAHQYASQLATVYNISIDTAAQVIASLSPMVSWDINKKNAFTVIDAWHNGKQPEEITVSTYNTNKRKAFDILNGKTVMKPSAPKTYAFYRNIMLDDSHVTIDRHAYKALVGALKGGSVAITPKRYKAAERAYKAAAEALQVKAYELQAIVWLQYKENVNR